MKVSTKSSSQSRFFCEVIFDFVFIEKVPAPIVESNKDETQTTSKDQNEPAFIDEKANLMKDLDTKIVVQVNCHQYFNDTYI